MSLEKLVFRQGANKSRAHQRSCCAVMQVAARATGHMTHLGRRVCIAAVETMLIFAKDAGAMPSVLAVCRSMTDSNPVGCGRSRDSREPQRSGENSCRLHGGVTARQVLAFYLDEGDKGIVPRQAELNVKGIREMIAIMAQAA
jgi:hypothetical protein